MSPQGTIVFAAMCGVIAGGVLGIAGYRLLLRRMYRGFAHRWIEQTQTLRFAPIGWHIDGVYAADWLGRAQGMASVTEDRKLEREVEELRKGMMEKVETAARKSNAAFEADLLARVSAGLRRPS